MGHLIHPTHPKLLRSSSADTRKRTGRQAVAVARRRRRSPARRRSEAAAAAARRRRRRRSPAAKKAAKRRRKMWTARDVVQVTTTGTQRTQRIWHLPSLSNWVDDYSPITVYN